MRSPILRLLPAALGLFVILPGLGNAQPADPKAEYQKRLEAARTEFVDSALRFSDKDADGKVTLAEQNQLLENFYAEFAKAGTKEAAKAEVLLSHKGLLKLQWFRAADLDDDGVMTKAELVSLVSAADSVEISDCLDGVWTLSDADIEPLVDDFKARIRKGVRPFDDDDLRKTRGEGRTKEEKLEDQSLPYRDRVVTGVLAGRLSRAKAAAFKPDERVAALKATDGWLHRTLTGRSGESETEWSRVLLVRDETGETIASMGSGDTREATRSMIGEVIDENADPFRVDARPYKFTSAVTDTSVRVEAGTFACKHIKVELGKWRAEAWVPDAIPFLHAKSELVAPMRKDSTTLMEYSRRT